MHVYIKAFLISLVVLGLGLSVSKIFFFHRPYFVEAIHASEGLVEYPLCDDFEQKGILGIIHGAKSKRSPWPRPGSDFHNEISLQAEKKGLGRVVTFGWSGKSGFPQSKINTLKEHIRVAEKIVVQIKAFYAEYLKNNKKRGDFWPFYLICHSNGGLVASLVSQMLYNPKAHGFKEGVGPSVFLSDALVGPEDDKKISQITVECRRLIDDAIVRARSSIADNDDHQIKIHQLILLGTPFDVDLYAINMSVVDKVCSLFSEADSIQGFFGKKRYPRGAGIMNFRIAVKNSSGGIFYPMHSRMMYLRGSCIARYLLELMTSAEAFLHKDASQFASIKGLDVLLDEQGYDKPVFEVIKKIKNCAFPVSGFN